MTQSLPLLIATDQNLLFAAATMLRSAKASLAPSCRLDVFAYVDGIADAELEQFVQFCETEAGTTPRLITDSSFSPGHQQLMNDLVEALPRFPRALWARLFLPSLVTEVERAVFSDIDVVVVGDLSPLWSLPLDGRAVGAVRDPAPGPTERLALSYPKLQRYFNAGVMAIDVPAWERLRVGERCVEWMLTVGRKSYFPDQDALNIVLMDEQGNPLWQEIDPIWNAINLRRDVEWVTGPPRPVPLEEVRLRHFAGSYKPWNTERLMLKPVFDEHLAAVPFPIPEHMRRVNRPSRLRRMVRRARWWLRRRA